MISSEGRAAAITRLSEIIRFRTVSGEGPTNGAYNKCGEWLLNHLLALGLEASILPESKPNKPIVVAKWTGLCPELPAVLLNGHYDVVPANESEWTVPAFEGIIKEDRIYGRGVQDMKSVCIQYLTAIDTLKELEYQPVRTILVSFVPDEETGGIDGMSILLASSWFTSHEIGCAMDEGLASEDDDFSIFYGERLPWWVQVEAKGNTGHASRFIEGTAVEQVLGFAQRAMNFRTEQKAILHGRGHGHHAGCSHSVAAAKKETLGDVTSLNITVMRAAVIAGGSEAVNVIPDSAELKMDIRIAPHMPPNEMGDLLDGWCREVNSQTAGIPSGGGLTWKQINNTPKQHHVTSCDPSKNPWYSLIQTCIQSHCGVKLNPSVFPAATDSRFLRAMGIKAFGFSPMRRSPILLHENDEYLNTDVFIEGCEIYARLLRALTLDAEFEPYIDPSTIEFKDGGCTWNGGDAEDDVSGGGCPMGYGTNDVDESEDEEAEVDTDAATLEATATTDTAVPVPAASACPYVASVAANKPAAPKCPFGYG